MDLEKKSVSSAQNNPRFVFDFDNTVVNGHFWSDTYVKVQSGSGEYFKSELDKIIVDKDQWRLFLRFLADKDITFQFCSNGMQPLFAAWWFDRLFEGQQNPPKQWFERQQHMFVGHDVDALETPKEPEFNTVDSSDKRKIIKLKQAHLKWVGGNGAGGIRALQESALGAPIYFVDDTKKNCDYMGAADRLGPENVRQQPEGKYGVFPMWAYAKMIDCGVPGALDKAREAMELRHRNGLNADSRQDDERLINEAKAEKPPAAEVDKKAAPEQASDYLLGLFNIQQIDTILKKGYEAAHKELCEDIVKEAYYCHLRTYLLQDKYNKRANQIIEGLFLPKKGEQKTKELHALLAEKERIFGNNALHWSIANAAVNTALYLIDMPSVGDEKGPGGLLNGTDKNDRTPLHLAILKGRTHRSNGEEENPEMSAVIDALLKNSNVDCTARDIDGNTPLHYAALCGDIDTCLYLINERKVGTEVSNNAGETPVQFMQEMQNNEQERKAFRKGIIPFTEQEDAAANFVQIAKILDKSSHPKVAAKPSAEPIAPAAKPEAAEAAAKPAAEKPAPVSPTAAPAAKPAAEKPAPVSPTAAPAAKPAAAEAAALKKALEYSIITAAEEAERRKGFEESAKARAEEAAKPAAASAVPSAPAEKPAPVPAPAPVSPTAAPATKPAPRINAPTLVVGLDARESVKTIIPAVEVEIKAIRASLPNLQRKEQVQEIRQKIHAYKQVLNDKKTAIKDKKVEPEKNIKALQPVFDKLEKGGYAPDKKGNIKQEIFGGKVGQASVAAVSIAATAVFGALLSLTFVGIPIGLAVFAFAANKFYNYAKTEKYKGAKKEIEESKKQVAIAEAEIKSVEDVINEDLGALERDIDKKNVELSSASVISAEQHKKPVIGIKKDMELSSTSGITAKQTPQSVIGRG